MKKEEMAKVEGYLRKTFGTKTLTVRARPKKDDSAEVYIGEDFVAVRMRMARFPISSRWPSSISISKRLDRQAKCSRPANSSVDAPDC